MGTDDQPADDQPSLPLPGARPSLPLSGARPSRPLSGAQPSLPLPGPRPLDPTTRGEALLPVTGAWRTGDPAGDRQFFTFADERPFALEGGGVLRNVTIAYETWGTLAADGANAVLVCHALTGDSHAAGRIRPGHPTPGWWDGLIGPGKAFDTDRYFVVSTNVLGGCQGSTGPASVDPATGRPYGSTFPVVTIRDMVRAQAALADELGIDRWLTVAGGSMGGMQALEWGVMFPRRVQSIVPIATTAAASALQIALSSTQRQTIVLDPAFRGGDYYDAAPGRGPHRGLALARQQSQITYRTDEVFAARFGRTARDELDFTHWQTFEVENYLGYHGVKLVRRFDANSFLVINKAMDLHDIGRNRGGIEAALRRITAPVLTMSIDSDVLYPSVQQHALHDGIVAGAQATGNARVARDSRFVTINSPDGHDAFLLALDQIAAALTPFLHDVEKSDA